MSGAMMLLLATATAAGGAHAAAAAAPNVPRFFTSYDWESSPDHGLQNMTNLAFALPLEQLDWVWGNHSIPGLWSFNGAKGGCQINKSIVIGEPYCGGKTGLAPSWKTGVQWVVDQIKDRPHVIGLTLGDEPEIQGVPYAQMCELSLFLKQTLIQAKRGDVFIHYNDGPASGNLKGNGMCSGLDYFSIDSYRDDPAAEVAASKAAYASLIPKLHKPNPLEPKGQGLWVVPGCVAPAAPRAPFPAACPLPLSACRPCPLPLCSPVRRTAH